MDNIYSTQLVAERLGCNPATIRRHANRAGIGIKVGRDWIFTQEQLDQLIAIVRPGPGCPLFVEGNRLNERRTDRKKATKTRKKRDKTIPEKS